MRVVRGEDGCGEEGAGVTNLRAMARGRPCLVRLPGCDGGGETTVLAHYSLAGISGRGIKAPDACASWCCFNCHEAVDGRRSIPGYGREKLRAAFAEGVMRTLAMLQAEGYQLRRVA
jgi:hypothetical protein